MKIFLDSVRKYRNAQEFRAVNRATLDIFEAIGDGDVIQQVCAKAIEAGLSGMVTVWRGDTLVYREIDLHKWANGKATRGEQPEQLKKAKGAQE